MIDAETFEFSYAYCMPDMQGVIRVQPEDFIVNEVLSFTPDGEGDHCMLQVQKRNTNTEWVARQLAKLVNIKPTQVGYAGMKDRNALTTQWFSVDLAGKPEPDWKQIENENMKVLMIDRNRRKLRRGSLAGNSFEIVISNLRGERQYLEQRLHKVAKYGVPNYFGEQRFGHDHNNVKHADELIHNKLQLRNRHLKSIYYSAARAWLFNQVLSRRIDLGIWDRALPGDVMMLDGTHSIFSIDEVDDELADRLVKMDIHPTGPLPGKGESLVKGKCMDVENDALSLYVDWINALARAGMKQQRRSLRLRIEQFKWNFLEDDCLRLVFFLPAGSYATSVLRELVMY